jgi:hypothetical protein
MDGAGTGDGGTTRAARQARETESRARVLERVSATGAAAVARWRTAGWRIGGAAGDAGTTTAEYAMVTMAAVAFAGLLALVLRSDEVRGMLTDLVHRALNQ